jgi:CubicO group peptidase (beta-lactamase class C family)
MLNRTFDPEQLGLTGSGVARVYGILDEAVTRGELMGASLQVSRNGFALNPVCFGRRQLDPNGKPVTADTIFLVASVTKPIVVAAAMQLVEQGKLSLDDQVAEFVPEFAQKGKEDVKIRHLMTHTSGLPDMLEENLSLRAEHAPLDVFVDRICAVDLLFAPGTSISYQSCGIAMLGEVVKRVEGISISAYLSRFIFNPLGLTNTALGVAKRSENESDVRIRGGEFEYGGREAKSWNWNSDYWRGLGAPWGGLLTTVEEMSVLCRVFTNGGLVGDAQVVSAATAESMTKDQTSFMPELGDSEKLSRKWGLGWRIRDRGSSLFGDLSSDETFGHEGATGTVVWMDPKTDLSCVFFTNDPDGARPLRARIANALCSALH